MHREERRQEAMGLHEEHSFFSSLWVWVPGFHSHEAHLNFLILRLLRYPVQWTYMLLSTLNPFLCLGDQLLLHPIPVPTCDHMTLLFYPQWLILGRCIWPKAGQSEASSGMFLKWKWKEMEEGSFFLQGGESANYVLAKFSLLPVLLLFFEIIIDSQEISKIVGRFQHPSPSFTQWHLM